MKLFDKLLKSLKTDRNTFFSYILILASIYVLVDRVVEFLFIAFTGVAYKYWGPIQYGIGFLCPIFAFLFSYSSKLVKSDDDKLHFLFAYIIALYILSITMITEFINKMCWIGLLSLPGYTTIGTQFAYLIKPALSSLSLLLPIATAYKVFNYINDVKSTKDMRDAIFDYEGINLSDKTVGTGTYTNEIFIGTDKEHGSDVKLSEIRRFESTLVVGVSGSGKTSLIFEPWVAQDISKKHFFRESSKTLAFAALKTGLATLNAPYNNEYINSHFNLNMISPRESKKDIYKSYFKKLIVSETSSKFCYRNLGITYMAPEDETIIKVQNICDNFGIPYHLVDPNNSTSPGLNPFTFDDPTQVALCISTVLKGFYNDRNPEISPTYQVNVANQLVASQIIENLAILLKVVYPKLNDGKLPNINDMLILLSNFELVEKMCKILEADPETALKYENQIGYFKKNFFKDSPNLADMQRNVSVPIAQLDSLLRYPGVKNILCNRNNNLNFDKILENGEVCLVCTRRGDLGESAHKLFGLFFLLLMQFSVLRRPGNENTRTPHFLYIDEFPDFICPATETIFTVYRKYRVGTTISAQSRSQLFENGEKIGNTIISNCSNKIVFGNNSPEDNEWWSKELGEKKDWSVSQTGFHTKNLEYDEKINAKFEFKVKYPAGKIQSLKFKKCMFKIKNVKGSIVNGTANLDFLPSKYKEKQEVKNYDFTNFNTAKVSNGSGRRNIGVPKNSSNSHFDDQAADSKNVNPIRNPNSYKYPRVKPVDFHIGL